MISRTKLLLLIALFVAPLSAQEAAIIGPATVKKEKQAVFSVTGVKDLAGSTISYEPIELDGKPLVVDVQVFAGYPFFFFSADTPLVYKLTLGSNTWVTGFYDNYAKAAQSGVNPADLVEIKTALDKAAVKYPSISVSRTIEVTGPRPPPVDPVDPIPDPSTLTGPAFTIIVRNADNITADQNQVLTDLRDWADAQDKTKIRFYIFAPDQQLPDGSPDTKAQNWFKAIPEGEAALPFVFVTRAKVGGGSIVPWKGKLPTTADEIITKVQEQLK